VSARTVAAIVASLFGGAVARMRPGAYAPVADGPPPLSWLNRPADGALLDMASDQRYTRYLPLYDPQPNPNDGMYATKPRPSLSPTFDIWSMLANDVTRLPSGPWEGSPYGVDVVGGMSFGMAEFNGLSKINGEG
jgi:hypothetical protein